MKKIGKVPKKFTQKFLLVSFVGPNQNSGDLIDAKFMSGPQALGT